MRNERVLRFPAVVMVLMLAACGGGGSSSPEPPAPPPPPPPPTSFSVEVQSGGEGSETDSAEVLLLRAASGTTGADVLDDAEVVAVATQRDGARFVFDLPSGELDQLFILARGIRDTRLNVGRGVELAAALSLFQLSSQPQDVVVVTPITTLALLGANGLAANLQQAALDDVLDALGGMDAADPRVAVPLLVALELEEFFPGLAGTLAANPAALTSTLMGLDVGTLPASLIEEATLRQAVAMAVLDAAADSAVTDLVEAANVLAFDTRSQLLLQRAGVVFDPEVVGSLAQAAVDANAGRSLGRNDSAGNVLRYLLAQYALAGLLTDPLDQSLLETIAGDDAIAQLVASGDARLVTVPLLDGELLGDDEARRREYYYASEAAAVNFVPRLFAEITDVQVTDAAQTQLVIANAEAARFELAAFLANTQIFQTSEQARALRLLGQRRGELFGQSEEGKVHLDRALELYDALVADKGIINFDGDDASFYLTLIRNYLALGFPDEAEAARAVPDAFIADVGQGAFTTSLGRLFTAYWRLAEAAVEAALAEGLNDPVLNAEAEALVDELAALSRNVNAAQTFSSAFCSEFRNSVDDPVFPVRGLYIQRSLSFYADLGLADKAIAVAEEDFPLVRQDDYQRCRTDAYIADTVESLISVGAVALADEFIGSMVASTQIPRAEAARGRAFARIELEQGNIEAAIAAVDQNITGFNRPRDLLYELLYFNRLRPGLAELLIDAGDSEGAVQVLDAAREYFLGEEFRSYATGRPNPVPVFLDQAGNRLAELYTRAGDTTGRDLTLGDLENIVSADLGATLDRRVSALRALSRAYLVSDRLGSARERLLTARDVALGLDPEPRRAALVGIAGELIGQPANSGRPSLREFDIALDYLAQADALAAGLCCEGVGDDELVAARTSQADALAAQASTARQGALETKRAIVEAARVSAPVDGLQAILTTFRERGRDWSLEAAAVADAIAVPGTRTPRINSAVERLAELTWREEAVETAALFETEAERNNALVLLSSALLGRTDLPGVEAIGLGVPVARVDTDNDGRPNFFSAAASVEAIQASGLVLDPDQDGDGVPDTIDRYPLDPDQS